MPDRNAGEGGPRVIKRYANRKLYDTCESRYVTLQEIANLVREGEDVTIVDNTTKDDLTSVTLAQILYEEEKRKTQKTRLGASPGALKTLIRQGGERLMSSLREGPVGKLIARGDVEDAAPGDEAVAGEAVVGEAVVGEAVVGEAVVGEAVVGDKLSAGAVETRALSASEVPSEHVLAKQSVPAVHTQLVVLREHNGRLRDDVSELQERVRTLELLIAASDEAEPS